MKNAHAFLLYTFALGLALGACGTVADPREAGEQVGQSSSSIKGGQPATAYPESALLSLYKSGGFQPDSLCSGAVIAPKVILTAGHCVDGYAKWVVSAPYAGGQEITSTSAATYDYMGNGPMVNPNQHDVALVFLDTPIAVPSYPTIAQSGQPDGTLVLNIGRIKDGLLSFTDLYVSQPVTVKDGAAVGYPLDYYAVEVIEPGDSGGPVVLQGAAPHTIVAVNSGGGTGQELLARVDLIASWIDDQIQAHGGPGGGGTGGGGGGGGGNGTGGAGGGPPPPPSSCEHDLCQLGIPVSDGCDPCATQVCGIDPYCCQTEWDQRCIKEADGMCNLSCGGGGGGQNCDHSPCKPGKALDNSCDPCVTQVCAQDLFCCNIAWDMICTLEAKNICGLSCN